VSQTLSVDELAAQDYIAVSKRDGDLGDFIHLGLQHPEGPTHAPQGNRGPK